MEKMKLTQESLSYEAPIVDVLHWGSDIECDIINASPEVGGEYDDNWN